jgi:hypothetical protein
LFNFELNFVEFLAVGHPLDAHGRLYFDALRAEIIQN